MNESKVCEKCGAEFVPKVFWQKYCDEKCRSVHHKERRKKADALLRDQEQAGPQAARDGGIPEGGKVF